MFFWTCSTVFSCAAAAVGAAGVCEGEAMPKLDSEAETWRLNVASGADFCARALLISITAQALARVTTRSPRMLRFIFRSDEVLESVWPKTNNPGRRNTACLFLEDRRNGTLL